MSKLKLYIVFTLALWLAFCGMATAEQFYVNESGWWQEGGAFNVNGAPIQAAVDAADGGDSIYVWNGSYSENMYISVASLILQGEGADVVTVTAASSMSHVFYVAANWVNISGFTVTGATGSTKAGICLYSADHCNIYNNNASNNKNGIYLSCSSNNTLTKNTISGNTYDFGVSGSDLSHYIQNIDTSNTVGGKPIYYWVDQKDKQIPEDAGFVGVVNSTNITVRDILLTNNRQGVLFTHTQNSKMENVTTSNNEYGIYLSSSSKYNTLSNNTANSNKYYGIYLLFSSNYNTLTKNTANSNGFDGICLYGSSNHLIENNIVNSNNENGIGLSYSSNNTLTKNIANSNIGDGIHISSYLYSSTNNMLTNNNCSNNRYGIYLFNTNNNNITCNLVQNNMYQGFYLGLGGYYRSINNNISYNNIIENGNYNATSGGWEWQFYNDQPEVAEAKHNYWGAGMNSSTIDASIYDDKEGGWGAVEFYPFETEPAPCAPSPEAPHTFTTIDAVTALQIAVGSRPPDLCWDVSGDGSVTSLDALMILQAADGG